MSKKKSRTAPLRGEGKQRDSQSTLLKSGTTQTGQGRAAGERPPFVTASATREIVESIVIAFVLAFLFRTFEAEAFVIPTGSMAPTLMGRHKDLICEECGFPFQASASDEINSRTNQPSGEVVIAATCPNCRHTMYVGPDPRSESHPSYKGDRILVAKFPYRFEDPERWDVAVFKFPGEARTNFIKRIVGLPGETIRIDKGDLYVKNGDREGWKIARKSPKKLLAMMRTVHDNDYESSPVRSGIWPPRWSSEQSSAGGGWVASEDLKSFRVDASDGSKAWIGYQHRVPGYDDWERVEEGDTSPNPIAPQLITDFTAYNTDEARTVYGRDDMNDVPPLKPDKLGLHWVGDLAVEAELEISSSSGEAVFELVEGDRRFQCRFDVATGQAVLGVEGLPDFKPTAMTDVRGPGTYRIFFANFDDQLSVFVDGQHVLFDGPTTFGPLGNDAPTQADLEPVRIGAAGAVLEVRHLKVFRDIYYIAERMGKTPISTPQMSDYKGRPTPFPMIYGQRVQADEEVAQVLSDPRLWRPLSTSRRAVEFTLDADQFLVLGDNSAESKDSRLWEAENIEYYVSRELLIGKALMIYWPHSLDRIPGTNIPIRFFPNFKRMGFVR